MFTDDSTSWATVSLFPTMEETSLWCPCAKQHTGPSGSEHCFAAAVLLPCHGHAIGAHCCLKLSPGIPASSQLERNELHLPPSAFLVVEDLMEQLCRSLSERLLGSRYMKKVDKLLCCPEGESCRVSASSGLQSQEKCTALNLQLHTGDYKYLEIL